MESVRCFPEGSGKILKPERPLTRTRKADARSKIDEIKFPERVPETPGHAEHAAPVGRDFSGIEFLAFQMHVEPGDPDSAEGAAPDGVKSLFFVNAEFGGQTGTAAEAEGRIDAQPYALSLCFLTDEADFARAVSRDDAAPDG